MRRPRSVLALLAFAVALGAAGCSSWTEMTGPNAEDLDRAMSAFRKQMLFGRYANAKTLVYPAAKPAFTRFTFEVEDRLRVTEFEVEDVLISAVPEDDAVDPGDPREARVQVRVEYTMRPDMEVHRALVPMVWVPVSGGWMLDFPEDGWKL